MLNLGILAHVDAGKTSLTERLLYATGVIDEIGRVDDGSTQTDTLALERQRGITIKAAVVSFAIDGTMVNLIDTPGHPDFIAEVERVLCVLDGAVLVISAVEGVQAQTHVLMRALKRLRIPTLIFVNKIDRRGADVDRVLTQIADRLTPAAVPMGGDGSGLAGRALEVLAEHDDTLLAAYLGDEPAIDAGTLRKQLAAQTEEALVYPVFAGSAMTGAGVEDLMTGITDLLPAAPNGPAGDAPASGVVFKVERGPAGEKIAYVRMFAGTLRVRDRLPAGKVTAITVDGRPAEAVAAGQIGKLRGLGEIRIGDAIGAIGAIRRPHRFSPPTLETIVVPPSRRHNGALHAALTQLAEQDPLINLRQQGDDILLSLYGEVQKEVIQATMADDFGLQVAFRESTVICVERPAGTGAAVERIKTAGNPFLATVGLRVDPAPPGAGNSFRLEIELGALPLAFVKAIEDTVHATLREGRLGWQVIDCTVTLTESGYYPRQSHAHARFDKSMSSTGADFRGVTPVVLMAALEQAGSHVLEPVQRFHLSVPAATVGVVVPVLARLGGIPETQVITGSSATVDGLIPAARVRGLEQQLPALTSGEGVLDCVFDNYEQVRGPAPSRPLAAAVSGGFGTHRPGPTPARR
jgi:ribosomal protection tetracycline resistance protein